MKFVKVKKVYINHIYFNFTVLFFLLPCWCNWLFQISFVSQFQHLGYTSYTKKLNIWCQEQERKNKWFVGEEISQSRLHCKSHRTWPSFHLFYSLFYQTMYHKAWRRELGKSAGITPRYRDSKHRGMSCMRDRERKMCLFFSPCSPLSLPGSTGCRELARVGFVHDAEEGGSLGLSAQIHIPCLEQFCDC